MSSEYLKATFFQSEVQAAQHKKAVESVVEGVLASPVVEESDETRDRQVLIRVSESQRDRWQQCADADGLSVSEWLRQMADARFREVFTCQHPLDQRRSYPWSELCLECGTRLR